MSTNRTVYEIPLIVDTVVKNPEFPLVRCNYLSVECDSPKDGWHLTIRGVQLPILMLGLVCIITRPFRQNRFATVRSIDEMYTLIQREAGLLINVDDVWLPLFLFRNNPPLNGQVYRVTVALFNSALSFREGRMGRTDFIDWCERLTHPLSLSDRETLSFSQWHELQLRGAIGQYPKNPNIRLRWEGEDDQQTSSQLR